MEVGKKMNRFPEGLIMAARKHMVISCGSLVISGVWERQSRIYCKICGIYGLTYKLLAEQNSLQLATLVRCENERCTALYPDLVTTKPFFSSTAVPFMCSEKIRESHI